MNDSHLNPPDSKDIPEIELKDLAEEAINKRLDTDEVLELLEVLTGTNTDFRELTAYVIGTALKDSELKKDLISRYMAEFPEELETAYFEKEEARKEEF